jgi:SAM-dependent methyltransferase
MSPGRENFAVLDWASAASQRKRFEVLVANVPLRGRSLLDVGCGLGDLLAYLAERGIDLAYTGVDVLARMVAACRERFGGVRGRFVQADVFADASFGREGFDVVFASGIFNLDLGNNREFLPVALRRLLELSREHVAANFLHVRARGRDKGYFFYDPDEVLAILDGEPCEVRLIDDYLRNDFTVICRKPVAAEQAEGRRQ